MRKLKAVCRERPDRRCPHARPFHHDRCAATDTISQTYDHSAIHMVKPKALGCLRALHTESMKPPGPKRASIALPISSSCRVAKSRTVALSSMMQKFSGKDVDSEPPDERSPFPSRASVELRRPDRSGRKASLQRTAPRVVEARCILVEAVGVFVYLNHNRVCTRPYAPAVARAWTLYAHTCRESLVLRAYSVWASRSARRSIVRPARVLLMWPSLAGTIAIRDSESRRASSNTDAWAPRHRYIAVACSWWLEYG